MPSFLNVKKQQNSLAGVVHDSTVQFDGYCVINVCYSIALQFDLVIYKSPSSPKIILVVCFLVLDCYRYLVTCLC